MSDFIGRIFTQVRVLLNPIFKILPPPYKSDFYFDLNGFRQENMPKGTILVSYGNLSLVINLGNK